MRAPPLPLVLALLALSAAAPAAAQQPRGFDYQNLALRGLGVDVARIWPARTDRTHAMSARADMGFLGPRVRVTPIMTLWSSRLTSRSVDRLAEQLQEVCDAQNPGGCPRTELGEIRVSDLSLGIDAHYVWPDRTVLVPYAGVGGAVHLLNGSGEAIDDTFVEDLLDAITPGGSLMAGLELPLGPFRVGVEARAVLATGVRYFSVGGGGSFLFLAPPRRQPVTPPPPAAPGESP